MSDEALLELYGKLNSHNQVDRGFELRPPYLEEIMPKIKQYVGRVRDLQSVVKDRVGGIELQLVEAEGHEEELLFESNWRAVSEEFPNWGLRGIEEGQGIYTNTGHLWVTVKSAKLRNPYSHKPKESLDIMRRLRDEIFQEHKPIDEFGRLLTYLDYVVFNGPNFFGNEVATGERKRVTEVSKQFNAEADLVRKGILSPSFINSLVSCVEYSSDLRRNHPGD